MESSTNRGMGQGMQNIPSISVQTLLTMNPQGQVADSNPIQEQKYKEALDFMEQVRKQFSDQSNIYTQFMEIMKEFKAQM